MPTIPHASRSHRSVRFVAGAAALALVLAGCGGGSETSAPAAAPTPPAPASSSAAAPSSEGTTVEVGMTEFALELSQEEFTPGTYTFTAGNDGQFPHTITINGPGVDNKSAGGPLQGGESADLTVDLQPGTYEMWCPVGDHKGKGMVTTITVA